MKNKCTVQTHLLINREFIRVSECQDIVPDPLHVEGALVFSVGSVEIFDMELNDLIVWLWRSLIHGLAAVHDRGYWQDNFPGQPIPIIMDADREKKHVTITVKEITTRSATADYQDFFKVLLAGGEEFFREMLRVNPTNTDMAERLLNEIVSLRIRTGFTS